MVKQTPARNSVLAKSAEVADTSAKRQEGLLGRDALPSAHGLWIVPCESIHTCGMRFPIDVLYLDRKKRVRKLRKAMLPWRFSMCLLAHSVLELPAGLVEQTETEPGDQLHIVLR
jgi:uncharacterized membrane protein (UPF0127 family)